MHRYEPIEYRALSGLAALAMAVVTMVVMVVLPATIESVDPAFADAESPGATPADAPRDARVDDRRPHHVAAFDSCLCTASTQAHSHDQAAATLSCD